MTIDHRSWNERVQDRAYLIWEAEGRPHGRSDEFWHGAADELRAGDTAQQMDEQSKASKKTGAAPKRTSAKAAEKAANSSSKMAKADPPATKKAAKATAAVESARAKDRPSKAAREALKAPSKPKKTARPEKS